MQLAVEQGYKQTTTTDIEKSSSGSFHRPSGCKLIPANDCTLSGAIQASDILMVDFDRLEIGGEGLYLIEELDDIGGIQWRGCRRFDRRGDSVWVDRTGEKDWHLLSGLHWNIRVSGKVQKVYKQAVAS